MSKPSFPTACAAAAVVTALNLLVVTSPAFAASLVDEVVAEQAEILVLEGPAGDIVEGYLVVWNGTTMGVTITDVKSEAFREVQFVQTEKTGERTSISVRRGLPIPPHAELMMRPEGVYLRIEPSRPLEAGDVVSVEVVFEDGSTQSVEAEVRSDEASLEAHLHDPGGRQWKSDLRGAVPTSREPSPWSRSAPEAR